MNQPPYSRRDFVNRSLGAAAPILLAAQTVPLAAAEAPSAAGSNTDRALKIVCVGGHPDDPESGCAGTLARYAELGHSVTILYLSRGERGIQGKSNDEAATIRSAECAEACRIIGAKPLFAGQIDGSTEFTKPWVEKMTALLSAESPNIVFTHWPIDTHMDHQVASMLTIRACMAIRPRPHVYFFEVNSGSQTQGFSANTYVDVSAVLDKKKRALVAHKSQDGEGVWRQHHEPISQWRGRETGVAAAEAFVHLGRDSQFSKLPGL